MMLRISRATVMQCRCLNPVRAGIHDRIGRSLHHLGLAV